MKPSKSLIAAVIFLSLILLGMQASDAFLEAEVREGICLAEVEFKADTLTIGYLPTACPPNFNAKDHHALLLHARRLLDCTHVGVVALNASAPAVFTEGCRVGARSKTLEAKP